MLIQAKSYAEGKRVHYSNTSPRRLRYVDHFVSNGGRGTQAALSAGFAKSSAAVTSVQLLRNPRMLDLIAAEVRRRPGDYAASKAASRLLRLSRPQWLRTRFLLALDKHASLPRIVGTPEHPALLSDPGEEAVRGHLSRHIGAGIRCASASKSEIGDSSQSVTGEKHRLPDAADLKSED